MGYVEPSGAQTSQDLQMFKAARKAGVDVSPSQEREQAEAFVRTMAGPLLSEDEVQSTLRPSTSTDEPSTRSQTPPSSET